MGRFSQKHGGNVRVPLKFDEVPRTLRHRLWPIVYEVLSSFSNREVMFHSSGRGEESAFLDHFWTEVLGRPLTQRNGLWSPEHEEGWFYERATWVEVYDAIDYIVSAIPDDAVGKFNRGLSTSVDYAERFNVILGKELSPWSFIGGELVLVSSPGEREAVDGALKGAPDLVRDHIRAALHNLNQRPEPNIRGAIAESVHAFESMAKHVLQTPKGTYPGLAQSLQARGVHKLFVNAFKDLYSRESDEGGTRHGFKPGEDPTKSLAEARLYVVLTSAFVNYMLEFYSASRSKEDAESIVASVVASAKG